MPTNDQLALIFRFNATDLTFNRGGRMSPRQKAALQSRLRHTLLLTLGRAAWHTSSRQLRADIRSGTSAAHTGIVQLGNDRQRPSVLLSHEAFRINARQYRELDLFRGHRVCVYYLPTARLILSAELHKD